MRTIHVKASREYDVLAGRGLLSQTGPLVLRAFRAGSCGSVPGYLPENAVVVSDSNVAPVFAETVLCSLREAGLQAELFVFPAGEAQKDLKTYAAVLDFLTEKHLTRKDILIALGGGVTGDLTGFAAATYLRGIPYIQIPTTLLAMVDSSVGGKTAIDLPCGKNLAGAFWQPSLVLCDTDCFASLPRPFFYDGFAEVIKYGMIGQEDLLRKLERMDPENADLSDVIDTCISAKRDLVEADEFDRGERKLLNFGHTFGHAVEAASGYRLSHGQSVAIGMAVMTRAAASKQLCPQELQRKLENLLRKYHLPVSVEETGILPGRQDPGRQGFSENVFRAEKLRDYVCSDKKAEGKTVTFIVPCGIAECRIVSVPQEDIAGWLRAGGVC